MDFVRAAVTNLSSGPLSNGAFRQLLSAQAIAYLSTGFFEVAILWWVVNTTGSGAIVATVALVGSLAYVIVAPVAGVFADRFSKKRIAFFGFLIDGILTATAGVLLILGLLNLPLTLALLATTNMLTAARGPALGALLPLIIPSDSYQEGNALMGLANSTSSLASFALAGLATATLGPGGALLMGASLLIVATIIISFFGEPRATETDSEERVKTPVNSWASFVEGVRTIRENRLLISIITSVTLINLILAPMTVIFAPFAKQLGLDAVGYGLLASAVVAGQLLGFITMNIIKVRKTIWLLFGGTICISLALFGIAYVHNFVVVILLITTLGFCSSIMSVQLQVVFQKNLPREVLGRAYGLLSALSMGAQPAGYAATGALLALYPISTIFIGMGLLMAVGSLVWLRPTIREELKPRAEADVAL